MKIDLSEIQKTADEAMKKAISAATPEQLEKINEIKSNLDKAFNFDGMSMDEKLKQLKNLSKTISKCQ